MKKSEKLVTQLFFGLAILFLTWLNFFDTARGLKWGPWPTVCILASLGVSYHFKRFRGVILGCTTVGLLGYAVFANGAQFSRVDMPAMLLLFAGFMFIQFGERDDMVAPPRVADTESAKMVDAVTVSQHQILTTLALLSALVAGLLGEPHLTRQAGVLGFGFWSRICPLVLSNLLQIP